MCLKSFEVSFTESSCPLVPACPGSRYTLRSTLNYQCLNPKDIPSTNQPERPSLQSSVTAACLPGAGTLRPSPCSGVLSAFDSSLQRSSQLISAVSLSSAEDAGSSYP